MNHPASSAAPVVANGKRRSWRRLRTRPTGPAGIAASAAAPVFDVVDMGNAYGDYDRWQLPLPKHPHASTPYEQPQQRSAACVKAGPYPTSKYWKCLTDRAYKPSSIGQQKGSHAHD